MSVGERRWARKRHILRQQLLRARLIERVAAAAAAAAGEAREPANCWCAADADAAAAAAAADPFARRARLATPQARKSERVFNVQFEL